MRRCDVGCGRLMYGRDSDFKVLSDGVWYCMAQLVRVGIQIYEVMRGTVLFDVARLGAVRCGALW